ncbi:hypothetical protein PIB30_081125 [Stylosanthes scabra]|uniref:Transposase MuDR plant domain-containing protein n=1 Tax=Stylosanthes scabra TaxID=79078 RepID=A0ABU6ZQ83_9FABA|nr:hypothetical protein [Stylosanthes scabra]
MLGAIRLLELMMIMETRLLQMLMMQGTHDNGEAVVVDKGEAGGGESDASIEDERQIEDENVGGRESEEDDSDDGEYVPSDVNSDSIDDVHFTDSEDDLDLGDSFFGNNAKEGGFGGEGDGDVGEDGDGVVYPVHKAKANMAEYRWQVGTVYASRDEFKEAVSFFAVHTKRGIKFDKVDKKRVIVCCQPKCRSRLYCVKLNQEDT